MDILEQNWSLCDQYNLSPRTEIIFQVNSPLISTTRCWDGTLSLLVGWGIKKLGLRSRTNYDFVALSENQGEDSEIHVEKPRKWGQRRILWIKFLERTLSAMSIIPPWRGSGLETCWERLSSENQICMFLTTGNQVDKCLINAQVSESRL